MAGPWSYTFYNWTNSYNYGLIQTKKKMIDYSLVTRPRDSDPISAAPVEPITKNPAMPVVAKKDDKKEEQNTNTTTTANGSKLFIYDWKILLVVLLMIPL